MKHLTFAGLALAFCSSAFAQGVAQVGGTAPHRLSDVPQLAPTQRIPAKTSHFRIHETSERPAQPLHADQVGQVGHYGVRDLVIQEQIIGITQYDLQSNGGTDNRLIKHGSDLSAAWTMSLSLTPWSDRGTGYNRLSDNTWPEAPLARIENVRTGWPSVVVTGDGSEVIISHAAIDTPLHMAKRSGASASWFEADIPSDLTVGKLWPRAAAGGADGNTLHVICISTPEANGGTLLNGQDGGLLYYRSTDGGDSWDIVDHQFPELDATQFLNFTGDGYAIHARGNTVAFAVFNDWADSFIMISEDNGETWTKELIVDFPVDLYVVDTGLPEIGEDWNEDGLFQEFFNADGAGNVHIDANGQIHVTFGGMYYMDDDLTDGGQFSYFPGVNGLQYWTPGMAADGGTTIAYAYDIDESGTLDLNDDIALYFVNLAGMPSMGSDAAGNLYLTYAGIMENFSTGVQNYRHIYLIHSEDGGLTWNTETGCDLTPDVEFDGYECFFPCIAPLVSDGVVDLIYQRDYEPGLHVRGDEDPSDINDIVHLRIPVDGLGDCSVITYESVDVAEPFAPGEITLYPNPAVDQVELLLQRPGVHQVQVYDLMGQVVRSFASRSSVERLDVSDLASGLYVVEVAQGTARTALRLAVR